MVWPNEAGRRRGKCACGFEGFVNKNGRLHQHSRAITGFETPSLVGYSPLYEPAVFIIQCDECGSLVGDQDMHDDWHQSIVDDLNLLRRQMEKVKATTTDAQTVVK